MMIYNLKIFPYFTTISHFLLYLVKVSLVTLLSNLVAKAIHPFININVICLVFGVIAHQLGFLKIHALNKAGVYDWLIYGLLAYIFSQLSITIPRQK